ncbi:unnamed protein product [Caenorhabditis angaria]|uniref:Receptor L-domain domain-containing protein n=1 Tax=Caenorhabditis angaria TaxID=860376 RepID=A0A9P1I4U9_9PELO|nr:unnamed protein product [Caenorhabditis angaria]
MSENFKFIFILIFFSNIYAKIKIYIPEDEDQINIYTYYENVYINQSTVALPDLDPIYTNFQSVYISGNIRITERELKAFFEKIRFFFGEIVVNSTNLKSLSFLRPQSLNGDPDTHAGLTITNNPNLTEIGIDFLACPFCVEKIIIENNQALDLRNECANIIKIYGTWRQISDNLYDCGCEIKNNQKLSAFIDKKLKANPKCDWIFGNVTIDSTYEYNYLEEHLRNITRITGALSIVSTNFQDFKFFKNLKLIDVPITTTFLPIIEIKNNTELKELGFNITRRGVNLIISGNPKLQITASELVGLFSEECPDSELDGFQIKFGADGEENGICEIPKDGSFENFPDGCVNLIGNLTIDDNFNYEQSYKLHMVYNIFGSIAIRNTKIRNLNFIPNLHNIYTIHQNQNAIEITNNSDLLKVSFFQDFGQIQSDQKAIFRNNTNLIIEESMCSFWYSTRGKAPIIEGNRVDCDRNDLTTKIGNKLNIDYFGDIPNFPDIQYSFESVPSVTRIPVNVNDREEENVATTTTEITVTENNCGTTKVLIISILMVCFDHCF